MRSRCYCLLLNKVDLNGIRFIPNQILSLVKGVWVGSALCVGQGPEQNPCWEEGWESLHPEQRNWMSFPFIFQSSSFVKAPLCFVVS